MAMSRRDQPGGLVNVGRCSWSSCLSINPAVPEACMIRLDCLPLSYGKLFTTGEMDMFKFLDTCRELGLDGVAIHADSLKSSDRPYLKEVRSRCLDLGLSISCFCVSTDFASSA